MDNHFPFHEESWPLFYGHIAKRFRQENKNESSGKCFVILQFYVAKVRNVVSDHFRRIFGPGAIVCPLIIWPLWPCKKRDKKAKSKKLFPLSPAFCRFQYVKEADDQISFASRLPLSPEDSIGKLAFENFFLPCTYTRKNFLMRCRLDVYTKVFPSLAPSALMCIYPPRIAQSNRQEADLMPLPAEPAPESSSAADDSSQKDFCVIH